MSSCTSYEQCRNICGYYEGDQKATTTYYTSGESQGIGSCGGCLYPACPNCGGSDDQHNYQNMYLALQSIKSSIPWTMAASAESMMGPSCPGVKGMGCTGRDHAEGKTADAPCGSCWELTNEQNKKINVVITDACPYEDNREWCPQHPGEPNQHQFYNHFDVWNGLDIPGWGDNPIATFRNIDCPLSVKDIIKEGCCGTYYDGSSGGSPQGCPNMCGSAYTCPSAAYRKKQR